MKRILSFLGIFFIIFNLYAADTYNKLDAYSRKMLASVQQIKSESELLLLARNYGYPFRLESGKVWVSLLVEMDESNSQINFADEVKVVSSAGRILSLSVPVDKLNSILSNEKVRRVQFGRKYRIKLDSARKSVRADEVHSGNFLPKPYTGKGTIVGIFDTGIDFQHPDFSDANGTRILFLWDMSADSAAKPPKGFDWGREYTKEEIDSQPENVLHRDHSGHGTHVAAIAAGNGSGKPSYKGIAPEADLIVVNGSRDPFASDFSDADIIAGCNYIFGKAEEIGKPCVINLSLGSIIHSHDGEDLLSKALSNLVENKPGRAIVAAAGNEGELDIHTGGQFLSGQRYELLLYPVNICDYEPSFCPDIPNIFLFGADIYTDSQVIDSIYVGIYSIENNEFIDEKGFSSNDVVNDAQIFDKNNQLVGVVSISYEKTESYDNFLVLVSNQGVEDIPLTDYLWGIVFVPKKNGAFDSWSLMPIGSQHPTKSRYQRFPNDNAMTIGSPAVGKKIISVGSYNTKNQYQDILGGFHDESKFFPLGDISVFSSRGPSRDGRILPILTAPGLYVVSAFSSSTDPNEVDSTMLDPSGMYVVSAGTSMSSPCVAGAVALLFEQTPNLTSDEVIELLKLSAHRDKFTSSEPNNTFGWGKLDVLRLLQLVTDVKEQINSKRISVYPNPATDKVFVTSDEEINEIQIFDVFGNLLLSGNSRIIQVAGLNSGAYFVKIRTKNNDYLTPLIKY